jgi:5-oxoprolinase (ATP-hydrolysing)
LESFYIREGSGGAGKYRGGDGSIRRLKFLELMDLMILSNRRIVPPFGLDGGEPGALGRNWVERKDGTFHIMTGTDKVTVNPGDVFVIETPGGGGFGIR